MGPPGYVKLCLPFPNAGAKTLNALPQYVAYPSARGGAVLLPAGCRRRPDLRVPRHVLVWGPAPAPALPCTTCSEKCRAAGTGFHCYLAASIECILLNLISGMNLLMDLLISLPYLMLIISSVPFFIYFLFFFWNEKKESCCCYCLAASFFLL